ncbi:MAG: N-acetyltransferase [Firmicutes bacterium]|nr:N-acetyltransferase [Bacillota bacterium]
MEKIENKIANIYRNLNDPNYTSDIRIMKSKKGEFFVSLTTPEGSDKFETRILDRKGEECGRAEFELCVDGSVSIEVASIYPEKRGNGIGSVLIGSALEFIRGMKANIVTLLADAKLLGNEITQREGKQASEYDIRAELEKMIKIYKNFGFEFFNHDGDEFSREGRMDISKLEDRRFLLRTAVGKDADGKMYDVFSANV